MDFATCGCLNSACKLFGKTGAAARLTFHDRHPPAPRVRCLECGGVFSSSTGTAYVGIRTDPTTYRRGVQALAEGVSICATGRLIEVDKDTVQRWLPILSQQCGHVMNYFFRNLHLTECQLDELWTFVYKKEAHLTTLEQLQDIYGDAWVWIAFSPVCKSVPAWVVGKRTLPEARRLVEAEIGHRWADPVLHFTSDELTAVALLVFPPRHSTRASRSIQAGPPMENNSRPFGPLIVRALSYCHRVYGIALGCRRPRPDPGTRCPDGQDCPESRDSVSETVPLGFRDVACAGRRRVAHSTSVVPFSAR